MIHKDQGDIGQTLTVRIYIVFDGDYQKDQQLTDRSGGHETVTLTSTSNSPEWFLIPDPIWSHPLTPGQYDIVVDVHDTGYFDPGKDKIDDSATVGFFVVPELPLGTLMAVMASMAAIGLAKNRLKAKQ
jgi:hypothetical protein